MRFAEDLRASGFRSLERSVDVVSDDIGSRRPRWYRPRVVRGVAHRAEHDAATGRPGQLRVVYDIAVAIHGGLFEADDVD